MEVQRIDHLHAWSTDVEGVARLFRDAFGLTCEVRNFAAWGVKTAVVQVGDDRRFIEFLQPTNPDAERWQAMGRTGTPGVFGVNFKVADMDQAIAELASRNIRQISDVRNGELREAWFDTEKLFGVQIQLSEYPGDNIFEAGQVTAPQKT